MSDRITSVSIGDAWEYHDVTCNFCGVYLGTYKVCTNADCPDRAKHCTITCNQEPIAYASADGTVHYCPTCNAKLESRT